MVAEQVVKSRKSNLTERLFAEEWNNVPQETYNAQPRRVAWVDHVQPDTSRRPTMNVSEAI